jgi:hypothetical protein
MPCAIFSQIDIGKGIGCWATSRREHAAGARRQRHQAHCTDIGAYFGLVPRRYQSAEIDYTGKISKGGDWRVRMLSCTRPANVMLTRYQGPLASTRGRKQTAIYNDDLERVGPVTARHAIAIITKVGLVGTFRGSPPARRPARVL